MNKVATLKSISRGFGSDNAIYESSGDSIMVCVGWALMNPHSTTVLLNGEKVAKYEDRRYIQPAEALSRLGYEVSGTVDFASLLPPMVANARMIKVTERKLAKIASEVIKLVMEKNHDYASAWQKHSGVGWAVRIADKLMRVENLQSGKQALVLGEDVCKTLIDNIGYSLLGLLWLEENNGDDV